MSHLGAIRDILFCPESVVNIRRELLDSRRLSTRVIPSSQIVLNDVSHSKSSQFLTDDLHAGEKSAVRELNSVAENSDETEAGSLGLSYTALQTQNQEEISHGSGKHNATYVNKEEQTEISETHDLSWNKYLLAIYMGNHTPSKSSSSVGSQIEDSLDHQFIAQSPPKIKSRRLSLMSVASVLDRDDFVDLGDHEIP